MIDPMTMMAIAKGVSSMAGGGDKAPAGPSKVFTPEMRDQYLQANQQYMNQQQAAGKTPTYGAGGVTSQQGGQLSSKEIKIREYAKFLESKGYDPENAQRRAQQIAGSNKEKFKDDKEFNRFVAQGNASGLTRKKGKFKTSTEFAPAGFGVSQESENIRGGMNDLSQEALNAARGLPTGYAQEEARALRARQGLAGQAQNLLQGGPGASGLYSTQEEALANMKNKYLNDFQGIYTDSMRGATSDLIGSGFNSSSLAGEYLQDNAYKPQSDFLTDALAKLAGQESNFLSQASGIGTQNLNNVLNSFNTLGQNQGIGSVLGGIMNPNQAGGFNDVQAAQLAAQLGQQGIDNRRADQGMMNDALGKSVDIMPEGPGMLSNLAKTFGGIAGAYAADKWMKPKAPTGVSV
tara:strand:+ start:2013 stop:3227 length:1215 start_codon:yes stop_codon:yes gene_type:complete